MTSRYHSRLRHLVLGSLLLAPAPTCSQPMPAAAVERVGSTAWVPPVGIPEVPWFNPGQVTPSQRCDLWPSDDPDCSYVDNTDPSATDALNPRGSPDRPRLTLATGTAYDAGHYLYICGGPYTLEGTHVLTFNGTENQPIWVTGCGGRKVVKNTDGALDFARYRPLSDVNDGNGQHEVAAAVPDDGPLFVAAGRTATFSVQGSGWVIIEGLRLRNTKIWLGAAGDGIDHVVIRHNELFGMVDQRGSVIGGRAVASTSAATNNVVIYGNYLHNNGPSVPISSQADLHGIKFGSDTFAHSIWIVDNIIHDSSGDSVQLGSANAVRGQTDEQLPHLLYVGRNLGFHNGENCFDMKRVRDVIISENVCHTFYASPSSGGVAYVTHNTSVRVWALNNHFYRARTGINIDDAKGTYVLGNEVRDMRAGDDASRRGSGAAGACVAFESATGQSVFAFNTLYHCDRLTVLQARGSTWVNNVLGPTRPTASGRRMTRGREGDASSAVARDDADPKGVFRLFESLYGLDIRRDILDRTRPQIP